MTTTGPFVQCEDLVRIFSVDGIEVQALQGLNLRIEPGELVAIVGASGSGKSTLLTILSGLDRPTGGTARVAGLDLATMSARQRVQFQRETVGFVWQQTSRNLLPYLTARENIALPLTLAGRRARGGSGGRGADAARVAELVELLDLGDCAGRVPAQLSGGQQQRTAIAVAVANDPRLLLADEPTGELDEAASVNVLRSMEAVNAELGVTVVIVTHDPEVSEHVDRTIQIRDGRTSREVLRRTETDEAGAQRRVVEEFAVLDRVGRMQLPETYLEALDLRDRVRLDLETDHVEVFRDVPREQTQEGSDETPSRRRGRTRRGRAGSGAPGRAARRPPHVLDAGR
ncbi:ABC transporter ATP-binding protein [Litorihabitans aurantiacus]|uniref:ABC transporter ATP-binding protein n=1 Tax=Litorihabitans aurantiacus TaxID=1930061 RepID=A0AA37USH8_9MICO|nr:ABC transporter ATP-binding protein [Litorihabitans aurantiacus]GMA30575.1 ABC transporter ATP-binding protein [Litorihabitans aurantiacus]